MSTCKVDIIVLNQELADSPPEQIIRWAVETFPGRVAVQSSMQKTAGVLMHMISRIAPETPIFFADTGVHFVETLELRDEFARRFGLNIITLTPERSFEEQRTDFGRDLYLSDDRNGGRPGYLHCCHLRKKVPFLNAVRGKYDVIISGLMREEGGSRGEIDVVGFDPRIPAYTLHPLAKWTAGDVQDYSARYDLPIHKLYDQGYMSIGCRTCTTPIAPGEDKRAGRWRHIREGGNDKSPLYCGINFGDLPPDSASGI